MVASPTTNDSFGNDSSGGVSPPAAGEDELVQAVFHRVLGASDRQRLLDRCDAALRLIGEEHHLAESREQIVQIIARMPGDDPSHLQAAAQACLRVLQSARLHGRERSSAPPAASADTIAGYELRAQARAARKPQAAPSRRWVPLAVLALLAIGAIGWLMVSGSGGPPPAKPERPLVVQMEAAAHGTVPASNLFGGTLSAAREGGHTVITVDGVPSGECVSAGWELVHKGLLTINGVTPNRVSANRINELCHAQDPATLIWMPKG